MKESEKRIPLDANSFTAGGKTFIIYASVNIERKRIMQNLEVQSYYGVDLAGINRIGIKWTDMKNKGKGFEADVMMSNMLEGGLRKVNNQHDPLMLICTLFMCTEDENRNVWDEALANEKLKLWSEEGYPSEDFLHWGVRFSRHYQQGLPEDSLTSLEEGEA